MEPGPDRIRGALALAMLAGAWSAAWTAVFVWGLTHAHQSINTALLTVAIVAVIAAGWAYPGPWLSLAAGFVVLGAGIGTVASFSGWGLGTGGLIACVLFMYWWRRTGPRLRLYRTGTRTDGETTSLDFDVEPDNLTGETTHVGVAYRVAFSDEDGAPHVAGGRQQFETANLPRVGDRVEVYYRPDDPGDAVAVFGATRR